MRALLLASDAAFLRAVAEHEDAVCVTFEERYVFANDAHARMVGAEGPEVLLGRAVTEFGEPGHRQRIASRLAQIGEGARSVGRALYAHTWPDGRRGEVEASSYQLVVDGELLALSFVRDVTEQKLAEARIAAQLEEKEVLLREIHHRVKNNLQVISSLLYLQQQRATSGEALDALRESTGRVAAMALIHEKLYASTDLARIDMRGYVLDLVASLFATYGVATDRVRFDVHGDGLALELDRATPCALIFNELLSNSLKHAFPNDRHGSIAVELGSDGNAHVLVLRDDGVGLPEHARRAPAKTLGLRLVERLAAQLGASLDYLDGHGTSYRLRVPRERR